MMRKKSSANNNIIFRVFVVFILSTILGVTAYLAVTTFGKEEEIENAGQTLTDYEESKAIYLNDLKYLPNPDVYTFFLGGVDKFGVDRKSVV